MIDYNIETKKFRNGNIEAKYNVNGTPKKFEEIDPRHTKACQLIVQVHSSILEHGILEKITTTFQVKG